MGHMNKTIYNVLRFRIATLELPGIGLKRAFQIVAKVGDEAKVDIAEWAEIASNCIKGQITVAQVGDAYNEAISILDRCEDLNIQVIPTLYGQNPSPVEFIEDPPLVLYVRGNKDLLYRFDSIAIVGTRQPNEWSVRVAARLARRCVEAGRVIVSGLAMGCDAVAHEKAIECGGYTVAVLPSGLDNVYPKEHRGLAEDILGSGGTLVSEYAPGEGVRKHQFRDRDRIQSGLSAGVIPVQTKSDGGTMITAEAALVQGREVMVPCGDDRLGSEEFSGNLKLLRDYKSVRKLQDDTDRDAFFEATAVKEIDMPLPSQITIDPGTFTSVVSLWEYVPNADMGRASGHQQTWHKKILAVKNQNPGAIRSTAERLSKLWWLLGNPDTIVVVPSSDSNNQESGIGKVAEQLSKLTGASYLKGALKRVVTLPRCVSNPSSRNRDKQRASMTFMALTSRGSTKRVILLDDIYTTGSTMGAGLDTIKHSGVFDKKVGFVALSLGKTVHVRG
jgi:DNA processing protein